MKSSFDFYKNFYGRYKNLLNSKRSEKEAKFLKKFIKCYDSQILDFGCGWGRHLKALAKLGYNDLTGVDSSEKLIEKSKELLINYPFTKLIKSDFIRFKSTNKYDFIYQIFQSFGFGTKIYDEKNLKNVNRLLSANGIYLLDLRNPIKLLNGEVFDLPPTLKLDFNPKKRKVKFKAGTDTEECNIYLIEELEKMFENASLKIIKTYGDFKGNKYTNESERLILVAKKA